MSCDEAFASELTTPFVALANSIRGKATKQKFERWFIANKKGHQIGVPFCWRRIRDSNSGTVLPVTRFPIVRPRPARRILQVFNCGELRLYGYTISIVRPRTFGEFSKYSIVGNRACTVARFQSCALAPSANSPSIQLWGIAFVRLHDFQSAPSHLLRILHTFSIAWIL